MLDLPNFLTLELKEKNNSWSTEQPQIINIEYFLSTSKPYKIYFSCPIK